VCESGVFKILPPIPLSSLNTSSLSGAIQKVEKKPDSEVSVRDAQDFVRYCMAIIADLSFEVDKLITPKGSS
jgi:hypothetical protein